MHCHQHSLYAADVQVTAALSLSQWRLTMSCRPTRQIHTHTHTYTHTLKLMKPTLPRSRMKESPLLKLAQDSSTSVALMALRPLRCSRRFALMSFVTTWWKPEATPPFCGQKWINNWADIQVHFEICMWAQLREDKGIILTPHVHNHCSMSGSEAGCVESHDLMRDQHSRHSEGEMSLTQ